MTGRASRSARTTRSAACRWSTRAPASRRRTKEGFTDERSREESRVRPMSSDAYSPSRETTEGRVYTVSGGGDWDSVFAGDPLHEERLVVNMGPQHPSTHGVLR